MGQFLSYSIVSGLLMLAMYLAYRVFLASENQHGYNRGILLLIYAISFAAVPVLSVFQGFGPHASEQTVVIEGMEVVNAVVAPESGTDWATVLISLFIIGMAVTTAKTFVTWCRLIRVIRSGERIERDGYTLIITDDEHFAPFCWMKYIVVSRKDYNDNFSAIATHELKHVASLHWIDLMIAQIICIINWFNPAAWLMRDELLLVHEYQADMAVIDSGFDPQQYQILLIKKAVGARFPSLANSLNHSKLKKRITMMYQEKSGAGRKFKALALVPMFALALGVVAVPAVRAAVTTISNSEVSVRKGSENTASDKTRVQVFKVTNLNNRDGKTTITIKGTGLGDNITVSTEASFTTNGKTYKAKDVQFDMANGEATIVATFPFVDVFEKSSMTLMVNGEEIPFDLENFFDRGAVAIEPDVLPQYPGGQAAMMQAVMSKVTFPDPELKWKDGASGLALIQFTVMPDGTMSDFKRIQSCGYGDLDQIAIDAIKYGLTEKWIPGTVAGKPMAVTFNIPIRFKLQGETTK